LKRYRSFSFIETIVSVGIISLLFVSFFEFNSVYQSKKGELYIKRGLLETASSITEILGAKIKDNIISVEFNSSNNSPISYLSGNNYTEFSRIDQFCSLYNIDIDNIHRNKDYWIICSKSDIDYAENSLSYLRVYLLKKFKEKWLSINLLRII